MKNRYKVLVPGEIENLNFGCGAFHDTVVVIFEAETIQEVYLKYPSALLVKPFQESEKVDVGQSDT